MKAQIFLLAVAILLAGCIGGQQEAVSEQQENLTSEPQAMGEGLSVSLSFLEVPSEVNVGEPTTIVWQVSVSKDVPVSSAIFYGKQSVGFPTSTSDYEFSTVYQNTTGSSNLAEELVFEEPGTYYLRVHAIVEGRGYWSEEVPIVVVAPEGEEQSIKTYNIEIRSSGVSPSSFQELANTKIRLVFKSFYDKTVVVEMQDVGTIEIQPSSSEVVDITTKVAPTFFRVVDKETGQLIGEGRIFVYG